MAHLELQVKDWKGREEPFEFRTVVYRQNDVLPGAGRCCVRQVRDQPERDTAAWLPRGDRCQEVTQAIELVQSHQIRILQQNLLEIAADHGAKDLREVNGGSL